MPGPRIPLAPGCLGVRKEHRYARGCACASCLPARKLHQAKAHIYRHSADVDPIAVDRAVLGDRPAYMTRGERLAAVRRLLYAGTSHVETARILRINPRTVARYVVQWSEETRNQAGTGCVQPETRKKGEVMTTDRYPVEILNDEDDDGTMPASLGSLADAVVGHRIIGAYQEPLSDLVITLDTGDRVKLVGGSDCCAYTDVEKFLLHVDKIDHIITGVGTTENYSTWHIYADMGDVLEMTVGWSCGNPFYYGYGFTVTVEPVT